MQYLHVRTDHYQMLPIAANDLDFSIQIGDNYNLVFVESKLVCGMVFEIEEKESWKEVLKNLAS